MARRERPFDDLDILEAELGDGLVDYLTSVADPEVSDLQVLVDLQPPRSVVEAAARAAAAVFIAFKRDDRMGSMDGY